MDIDGATFIGKTRIDTIDPCANLRSAPPEYLCTGITQIVSRFGWYQEMTKLCCLVNTYARCTICEYKVCLSCWGERGEFSTHTKNGFLYCPEGKEYLFWNNRDMLREGVAEN